LNFGLHNQYQTMIEKNPHPLNACAEKTPGDARNRRVALKGHRSCVVWLTGISGAGKSTIGQTLEGLLCDQNRHTYLLDGDEVRQGLSSDLSFSSADRSENIRRIGEVAKVLADAGLIVIVAAISPFAIDRNGARRLLCGTEFIEVHVHAPLDVAEGRDPKGLYARARNGQIRDFTGISSSYEEPADPELRIDTIIQQPFEAAMAILALLEMRGVIGRPQPVPTGSKGLDDGK
jgi:bifunctional enzyme CysN/CysC